jgi:hypothetical protein
LYLASPDQSVLTSHRRASAFATSAVDDECFRVDRGDVPLAWVLNA